MRPWIWISCLIATAVSAVVQRENFLLMLAIVQANLVTFLVFRLIFIGHRIEIDGKPMRWIDPAKEAADGAHAEQ